MTIITFVLFSILLSYRGEPIQCFGYNATDVNNVCSGRGNCSSTNTCQCDESYYGVYCNITVCHDVLSNETVTLCQEYEDLSSKSLGKYDISRGYWTEEIQVNWEDDPNFDENQILAGLAPDYTQGGFLAAYYTETGSETCHYTIVGRFFDIYGTPRSESLKQLSDRTDLEVQCGSGSPLGSLTAFKDGSGYVLSYVEATSPSIDPEVNYFDVYVQLLHSDGSRDGDPFQVSDRFANGSYRYPDNEVLTDSSFVVIWEGPDASSDTKVHMKQFERDGTIRGDAKIVNEGSGSNDGYLTEKNVNRVNSFTDGTFLVCWDVLNGVEAQRFYNDGPPKGDVIIVDDDSSSMAQIATFSDDSYVIVYTCHPTSEDCDTYTIVAQKYLPDDTKDGERIVVSSEEYTDLECTVTTNEGDQSFFVAFARIQNETLPYDGWLAGQFINSEGEKVGEDGFPLSQDRHYEDFPFISPITPGNDDPFQDEFSYSGFVIAWKSHVWLDEFGFEERFGVQGKVFVSPSEAFSESSLVCVSEIVTERACSTGIQGKCIDYDVCNCTSQDFFGSECENVVCFGLSSNDTDFVCSSNGVCISSDTCACYNKFFGDECEFGVCNYVLSNDSNVCSSHGDCNTTRIEDEIPFPECRCEEGYYGWDCEIWSCFSVFTNDSSNEGILCSGYGDCTELDTCQCFDKYYYGIECNISNITECFGILSNDSSSNRGCGEYGECIDYNVCECDDFYFFSDETEECSVTTCFNVFSNVTSGDVLPCSGHGSCLDYNECQCRENYFDILCDITMCNDIMTNDTIQLPCGDHGRCEDLETCACDDNYFGSSCIITTCNGVFSNQTDVACEGNGRCEDFETCVCDDNYFGSGCSITSCNGVFNNQTDVVCEGNGRCDTFGECSCFEDFQLLNNTCFANPDVEDDEDDYIDEEDDLDDQEDDDGESFDVVGTILGSSAFVIWVFLSIFCTIGFCCLMITCMFASIILMIIYPKKIKSILSFWKEKEKEEKEKKEKEEEVELPSMGDGVEEITLGGGWKEKIRKMREEEEEREKKKREILAPVSIEDFEEIETVDEDEEERRRRKRENSENNDDDDYEEKYRSRYQFDENDFV